MSDHRRDAPPAPTIRRAAAGDAALLAELGARTFREAFGPENDPDDLERYLASAFSEDRVAAELAEAGSTFFVAEVDGAARGYARILEGAAPGCVRAGRPVELVRIYAASEARGRGVGAALMRTCLDTARDAGGDAVWLGVWERNPRAIAFYRRWGFEEQGTKTFVVGDDVQRDLVMVRGLEEAPG